MYRKILTIALNIVNIEMIIIENITLVIERHLKRSRKRREPIRIPRHSLAIMSQCRVLNLSCTSHKWCACLSVRLSVCTHCISNILSHLESFFHIPSCILLSCYCCFCCCLIQVIRARESRELVVGHTHARAWLPLGRPTRTHARVICYCLIY